MILLKLAGGTTPRHPHRQAWKVIEKFSFILKIYFYWNANSRFQSSWHVHLFECVIVSKSLEEHDVTQEQLCQ